MGLLATKLALALLERGLLIVVINNKTDSNEQRLLQKSRQGCLCWPRAWYNLGMSMEDNYGFGAVFSFVLGWFLAQSGKLVGDLVRKKGHMSIKDIIDCFTRSGGMPSGHTASFVGLSVYLGWKLGFCSSIFALAICTTAIVIYDAVNVRFAVGKQGELLNLMVNDSSKDYKKLKVIKGHTVPQVIVGAIMGVLIGTIVSYFA